MKKSVLQLLIILSVAMNISFIGAWVWWHIAQEGMRPGWVSEEPARHRMMHRTFRQHPHLRGIVEEKHRMFQPEIERTRREIMDIRVEIARELSTTPYDQVRLDSLVRESRAKQDELTDKVMDFLLELKKELPEEDQDRVFKPLVGRLMFDALPRKHRRRGGGPPGPPPEPPPPGP